MSSPSPIQTLDLTRYYGPTVGVEGLDLEVRGGEVFGFLGPNGAGKTTTIRLLLDLLHPTRGASFLFGLPSRDHSLRSRVGYLPGELALDGRMRGRETLGFFASLSGRDNASASMSHGRELCERLGLTALDLERRVRDYSRGMKQKLGLVAAFQHNPGLLILDEPTTGLDPLVREVVFQLMAEARSRGATVFHSSHVLSEVDRTCDRVGVLRDGRLVALLTVEEARRSAVRRMVVDFREAPPAEEIRGAGLQVDSTDGRRVVFRVAGELDALLGLLARHPVEHLSFPEPNLEDAFDALYRGEPGGGA